VGEGVTHHQFTGSEIELGNGLPFDVADPSKHLTISLGVIARSLSKNKRYGGHDVSEHGYSIAEHAVLVSGKLNRLGAPLHVQMAGLHHDDAEALNGVGDPQRPAKGLLGEEFRQRERLIDRAVWRALAWPHKAEAPLWRTEDLRDPLLVRVDHEWAIRFEARRLMVSRGLGWEQSLIAVDGLPPIPDHDEDELGCWSAPEAYAAYLATHHRLARAITRHAVAA
jgi:hypothetical protein